MLSISKPKNAASGMAYFEADSYYAKKNEQGQWFGNGLNDLNITGGIERSEFRHILDGVDMEGNSLVQYAGTGKRRSYVDFTFSCPKSVSVLSYVDGRIEQAHNTAVIRALEEIERNYAIIRTGAQGQYSYKSNNIVAARFNHHESRELEPQLHSHCVIMNMTQGADKKWRALEMGEMFKNQLYIGQVYRNELAKELTTLGYKIDVTERSKGLFEIAGVKREIIDEFSTRRKQVLEGRKHYEDYNIRDAQKFELACLDSRKYKVDSDVEQIRIDTEKRLQEYGTTLETLKQESMQLSANAETEKPFSVYECLSMAFTDITENQSAFRKEDVLQLAFKNGLGIYSKGEIIDAFHRHHELVKLGEKDILIGRTVAPNVEYFTTQKMVEIETGIFDTAVKLDGAFKISVPDEEVRNFLQRKETEGIEFTEGQKAAIKMMSCSNSFINICQGDAGAGKTFAVESFREIMNEHGFTVRGFAPTAKAAVELQSAKIETSTVDSFLLSKKEHIGTGEIWVVDESGMLGSKKLSKFLKEAENFGAKVILIGDSKQFSAVEQGRMFADLQKNPFTGYSEITEVRRQKTEHMKQIVSEFKKKSAENVMKAFDLMDTSKGLIMIKDRQERLQNVAKDYLEDREKWLNTIVLTATNKDRTDLNSSIRSSLIERKIVDSGASFLTLQGANLSGSKQRFADSYSSGQRVFFQKPSGEIKQGSEAEVVSVDPKTNTMSVKIISDKREEQAKIYTIDLFKDAKKIQAFNVVHKNFGVGDSIITLKNDKLLGLENGKMGTIRSINKDGMAQFSFSKKRLKANFSVFKKDPKKVFLTAVAMKSLQGIPEKTELFITKIDSKAQHIYVEYQDSSGKKLQSQIQKSEFDHIHIYEETRASFNLNSYRYLDHAYAVTSYKSQGATVEQVRWCHDHTQKTNYNEAYVAITRAELDAVVYTSDSNELINQAIKEQQKESVIQWNRYTLEKQEKEHAPSQSGPDIAFDNNLSDFNKTIDLSKIDLSI